MRHDVHLAGQRYMLRPVEIADAPFVVELRSDPRLNAFINETSPRVEDQVAWTERYFERYGDWYFIIADRVSGNPEGTIGIYEYDSENCTAEWGRWIVRSGSLAALESALLMYRVAFETLGLRGIYSRTVAENKAVVSFHDSCGAPRRAVLSNHVQLGGRTLDSIEHYVDKASWGAIRPRLQQLAHRVAAMAERKGFACSKV